MTGSWLDWVIIGFIVLSIGFVVFRTGSANPESTGRLGRKVNDVANKVNDLRGRLGFVEQELEELKRDAATTKDIERIEERIQTVRAEMQGHHAISQQTNHSVTRIERLLIERGLPK